ncbi:hypothetical protein G6F66_014452 [Rhizopus arrhizus]|nr:hypothetical protein G6F66_014452 [Rhizopus arrhizus]
MLKLSLDALQILDAIDRRGSFAGAGKALHKVPSTISYTVAKLEEDLGVVLLHRSARGVAPTTAGTRLLAHAREILGRIDAARADVREDLTAPRGTVSLAMSIASSPAPATSRASSARGMPTWA